MKYIYLYRNLINNKKYVGQTNNIERRKKQHRDDSFNNYDCNRFYQPIHCAIRKYGLENFEFKIIEECLEENASEREQYWIKFHKTLVPGGYNLTNGGEMGGNGKSRYSEEEKEQIRTRLFNNDEINQIAIDFHCSPSFISSINCGNRFKSDKYIYPLQNKQKPDYEKYKQVVFLIKNSNIPLCKIAKMYDLARNTVSDINKGKQKFVKENFDEDFPLRKKTRQGYTLKPVETIPGQTGSKMTIDTSI